MSVEATSWAWNIPPGAIGPSQRLVLLRLADHADEEWSCWPTLESLQRHTSLSERTVRTALRQLETMGALRVEQRFRRSSRYYLRQGWRPSAEAKGADAAPFTGAAAEHDENCSDIKSLDVTPDAIGGKGANGAPLSPKGGNSRPLPTVARGQNSSLKGAKSADLGGSSCPQNHHRTIKEPSGGERASARSTPRPLEDWHPGEDDRQFAAERGLDPDAIWERFQRHFRAKGGVCADWSARWQLWCLEDSPKAPAAGGVAAAGGEPAAAGVLDRDADGLTPRERALVDEFAEMVRLKVPEDNQRRIKVEGFLRNHCAPAWEVACRQVAA